MALKDSDYYGVSRSQILAGLSSPDEDSKLASLQQIKDIGESGAVALGLLSDVSRALNDSSSAVRIAALEAIGQMGQVGAQAAGSMVRSAQGGDIDVRCAALQAFGNVAYHAKENGHDIVQLLKNCEGGSEEDVRLRAGCAEALAGTGSQTYRAELDDFLRDPEPSVVVACLRGIGKVQVFLNELPGETNAGFAEGLANSVGRCLKHQEPDARSLAAFALSHFGKVGHTYATDVVTNLLSHEANMVRSAGVDYFKSGGKAAEAAAKLLSHSDGRFQAAAAMALGYMQASRYASEISALLRNNFEDEMALALTMSCAEPRTPIELRRPACAAATVLSLFGPDVSGIHADEVASLLSSNMDNAEAVLCFGHALGSMGRAAEVHVDRILDLLKHECAPVRAAGCTALGELGEIVESTQVALSLAELCKDRHPVVREEAVNALGCMQTEGQEFSDSVVVLFKDRVAKVQIAALKAMGKLGIKGQMYAGEVARVMNGTLYTGSASVRVCAAEVLSRMGERGAAFAEEASMLLGDPDAEVREGGLKALAAMEGDEPRQFLKEVESLSKQDPLFAVRERAKQTVEALRSFGAGSHDAEE